jgi:preprotein translocase subunit SecA
VIPTNRPARRVDENDRIYKTRRENTTPIETIKAAHGKGNLSWLAPPVSSQRTAEPNARCRRFLTLF